MKEHFVETENYTRLKAGMRFMKDKGSPSSCLCLVHGDPGVGKTRNMDYWGGGEGAILIHGHVGMKLRVSVPKSPLLTFGV